MPAKFHIHAEPARPRFRPMGKLGIVDWREDCSNCHNCVKKACVYGLYRDEADTLRDQVGYLDYIYQCKGCLNCIQNCTKGILSRVVNPEYERLGDEHFTPDIILSTWFQAETGQIPVSGGGYGGPFSGPGFDSMWTDMSEIVRPTRDGIHGREYISTSVVVGRKLLHLSFTDGNLNVSPPPVLEVSMPVIFDVIPDRFDRGPVVEAAAQAAAEIGSMAVVHGKRLPGNQNGVIPLWENPESVDGAPMVMVPDDEDIASVRERLKKRNAAQIVAIRVEASPKSADRVVRLVREGVEVIHLVFDSHGWEHGEANPRHMRDVLQDVHRTLVKNAIRDEVTLIASGGIALPEHVAKAIICGADLVAIDIPLLIALECRLCGECTRGERCPIDLAKIDRGFAVRRIVNLMGGWHSQLLEMLGAMGIREVRRLRGEKGRAMFFENLERETFGRLFGQRKDPGKGSGT